MRLKRLMVHLVLGGGLIISAGAYADIEDNITRDFPVKPGGTLVVESELGSVQVKAGAGDKVEVSITLIADTDNSDKEREIMDRFHVDFNQDGNRVAVVGEYDDDSFKLFQNRRNRLKVEYYIMVPKQFDLDIHTGGGGIGVLNIEGTMEVETAGGSLNFTGAKGNIRGRTSGGSISLRECDGEIDIKTSGGSINMERATGEIYARTSGGSINLEEVRGSIDASTSGGSVTAEIMEQPSSPCRLTTSGGSVTVYLSETIQANIDAETSAGKIKSDFPLKVRGRYVSHELQGEINGGGPEIYLRTSAGNININKL